MALKDIKEIRTDYIDDDNLHHVDAWFDNDDNSQGTTICVVDRDTRKVIFFDNGYRLNERIKDAIKEIMADIDQEMERDAFKQDKITIATLGLRQFQKEYNWLKTHFTITYKDMVLKEDLFNANILDDMDALDDMDDPNFTVPDYIAELDKRLSEIGASYVRFIH